MKKLLSVSALVFLSTFLFAQDSTITTITTKKKKDWSKVSLDQAGDHFMITLSSDHWSGAPDSISSRMKGLSRGLAIAIMLNKPFKSDPRWSVALGLGISNSSMFFKNTSVDVAGGGSTLAFSNLDSTDHFKKYKLSTTFAEVPVELRYTKDPENQKKSFKVALGVKLGTLLNAHTKGKTLQNKSNTTINNLTEKESKKAFFNSTRLAGTARVGLGNFSLVGTYTITSFLKDGAGPTIRPYQIGFCISGL
ncbi:MAG: outer membrane beta-barrel protein [Ferruginibacter sp.]